MRRKQKNRYPFERISVPLRNLNVKINWIFKVQKNLNRMYKKSSRSLLFNYPNLIFFSFFFFLIIVETFQIDEEASKHSRNTNTEFRLYPVARHIIHL